MDPCKRFPSETTSYIFSFLSHSSICQSELVSSSWRETIINDPSLYQKLDLLSCFHPFNGCGMESKETEKMIQILETFAQRSNNSLEDVSLDLTSVWCRSGFEKWCQTWLDTDRDDFGKLPIEKLFTILRDSSRTLKRLRLLVSVHSRDTPESCLLDLSLAKKLIEYLRCYFFNVTDLNLLLPCEVEIRSESSSRKFSLVNPEGYVCKDNDWPTCSYELVRDLLAEIAKVTNGSLTHFSYNWPHSFEDSDNVKIINLVGEASSTLQSLNYGALAEMSPGTEEGYKTFLCSPNLSSFRFAAGKNTLDGPDFYFSIPEAQRDFRPMEIVCLDLGLCAAIIWDERLRARLSNLQELILYYNYHPIGGQDKRLLPFGYLTTWLSLNSSTLKILKLGGQSFGDPYEFESETLTAINLPNLRNLSLKCFTRITKPLLLKFKLRKLTHLMIGSPESSLGSYLERQRNFLDLRAIVWPIILESRTNLEHLHLDSVKVDSDRWTGAETVVFPTLRQLSLPWQDGGLSQFFSGFNYPELIEVNCDHFFYGEFLARGPKIFHRNFHKPSQISVLDFDDDMEEEYPFGETDI